jgi:hypothetical protein
MAQKRIEIIYDVNGKAIDVAVDSTLNLKRQVVELTKALRSAKEGSDEFKVLSQRLGDAEDGLAKTTAKSKDLFTSLSMLPGPVGQFFSQLQGGIELMKTFTSFTLKDLQFQFKQTADDIGDIGKNITGAKKAAAAPIGGQGGAVAGGGGAAAATAGGLTAAISSSTEEWKNYDKVVGDLYKKNGMLITQYPQMINGVEVMTDAVRKSDGSIRSLSQSEIVAINSGKALTVTTEGLIVAEKTATFWTTTLGATIKSVLIASGIGIAIVAIGELVSILYKMVSSEEAAAEATKKLNKELENQNLLLDLDSKALKRRNNEIIALMKSQGKSEGEIRKVTLKNAYDEYTLAYNAEVEARKTYNANIGKVDADGLKAMEKNLLDREQATKDAYSAYKVLGLNQKADELKDQQAKNKELEQKNQQHLEKVKNDNKTADQTELSNQREIAALSISDERKRQEQELQNQKLGEQDKIQQLEISKERKGQLDLQIENKYALKLADLRAKFNKEDEEKKKQHDEKVLEWTGKVAEMAIQAIVDQTEKEKAEKQKKYKDDLAELDKALKDKLITEEQYNEASKNLKIRLNNEIIKIDEDKRKKENEELLKKLDDDIRFQEIANEANKNSFIAYWKGRETLLDKAKQRELAQLDLTEAQKNAIEKKYVQLSKDLQREKYEAYVGYLNQGLGAVQSVLSQELAIRNIRQQDESDALQLKLREEQKSLAITSKSKEEYNEKNAKIEEAYAIEQDKIKEKYFYRNKDAQYAQALIAASQAAISAYASLAVIPVVGPALGIAAAAVALGYGIKQANLIKAQKYVSTAPISVADSGSSAGSNNMGKNYEEGGLINGPRHAQGGVMIEAEGGEAVMTRGAVTMFAPLLSAMNQMGGGTSFTRGAAGQAGYDAPKVTETITQPQIVKTYVVSSELTTEAQKQARLKDLSTL